MRGYLVILLFLHSFSESAWAKSYCYKDIQGILWVSKVKRSHGYKSCSSSSSLSSSMKMDLKNTRNTVIYLKPNKYKAVKNKLESSIEIKNFIQEQASHFNVDPVLVDAIITVESEYNLNALSPKGALGLMQLMPATARELAKKEGVQFEDGHLLDPKTNIRLGVKYLAELGNRYNNNVELVLAAYHAGIGNVAQYNNKVPPFESTRRYVRDVTCLYNNLHSTSVMSTLCKL